MLAFHYILAFAIDYTLVNQKPTSTNCVFSPFWDTGNLSPSAVAAVKAAHPNVAVMVGIGGDNVQDNTKVVFTPTSIDSCMSNVVMSLTSMVNTYRLDGVDVDWEHFADGTDVNTFVECIGCLPTHLKKNMSWIKTSIRSGYRVLLVCSPQAQERVKGRSSRVMAVRRAAT
jgi:GH18 family chitinase